MGTPHYHQCPPGVRVSKDSHVSGHYAIDGLIQDLDRRARLLYGGSSWEEKESREVNAKQLRYLSKALSRLWDKGLRDISHAAYNKLVRESLELHQMWCDTLKLKWECRRLAKELASKNSESAAAFHAAREYEQGRAAGRLEATTEAAMKKKH